MKAEQNVDLVIDYVDENNHMDTWKGDRLKNMWYARQLGLLGYSIEEISIKTGFSESQISKVCSRKVAPFIPNMDLRKYGIEDVAAYKASRLKKSLPRADYLIRVVIVKPDGDNVVWKEIGPLECLLNTEEELDKNKLQLIYSAMDYTPELWSTRSPLSLYTLDNASELLMVECVELPYYDFKGEFHPGK